MAGESEDPVLLFSTAEINSPLSRSSSLSDPPASPKPLNAVKSRRKDASFFVEVPHLSEESKDMYEPANWSGSESEDDEGEIVEIVGERAVNRETHLFALYKDGIIRKKADWEFRTSHPDLYEDYRQKKEDGTLADFDYSASNVHPRDRVGLVISIDRSKVAAGRRTRGTSNTSDNYEASSTETEDEESSDDDGDEDYKGTKSRRRRRARRRLKESRRILPFSPKTTRPTRGARPAIDLADDSDTDDKNASRRRSERKQSRKIYTVNDDSDYEMEEQTDDDNNGRSSRTSKKVVRRKGPKPAYGRVRDVEDLYDSEPETAPLRGHRDVCEKCRRQPAHILLKRRKKGRKKKSDENDEFSENDEDYLYSLGGWVRCLKCCVSAHWGCLAKTQQAEILKAARANALAGAGEENVMPLKIMKLDTHKTTEFICGACSKGGLCMICMKTAVEAESKDPSSSTTNAMGLSADTVPDIIPPELHEAKPIQELLFRCYTCKRLAHYRHLSVEDGDDWSPAEVAEYYQKDNHWQCQDCASYKDDLDRIIAWRPYPPTATDDYMGTVVIPNHKANLPREYLVKWAGRSYRRTEWVPHMWLLASNPQKLKNFYTAGPKIDLLESPVKDEAATIVQEASPSPEAVLFSKDEENTRDNSVDVEARNPVTAIPPLPLVDAEMRIPLLWKTVDRVLDVLIWSPWKNSRPSKKGSKKHHRRIDDEAKESDQSSTEKSTFDAIFETGREPSEDITETIDEYEKRTGLQLEESNIKDIVWAFIKWDDLSYEEATWDAPPRLNTPGYGAYQRAFKRFLVSRTVTIPKRTKREIQELESRSNKKSWNSRELGIPEDLKYDIGQSDKLNLMPFQVHGVNWLCRNWFFNQQCILADEMGLGKTVQIVTFLGILHAKKIFPSLVVVPNSTITNWVREFERWAPHLRVVPFYGEQKSRDVVKKYELQHFEVAPGTTGAKYHVLVTTYDTIATGKDFTPVFKNVPRWEVLVVDEGQRLKNDESRLFSRLNELKSCHRIIMTGTPLNNNIRELFNLMNFLDPEKWRDLDGLTKEFEELNEELVKKLHERLRPYFLRRVKADVLSLPPKNEVIVPLSMTPLQREIYKSILSKNLDILRTLAESSSSRLSKVTIVNKNMKNILMQLRKCLQHPYLISDDIEPTGLKPVEAHLKLIDASAKLRFLKLLLPKLKTRGHRVLLFSQFVINLNIVEDFLQGEGYKFCRLDGDTKQADRQKGMDEFNRENSDVFIYILSTRAGGVGINLWSADTVIIFDPDFNPHQDLQAIARAHRFGQKKTCLVFKLMTKDSAEERIMQTGKKKLVLDHLIVQKMDDVEDANDVQSMLTYGAKALFDDSEGQESREITYSEQDVDKLIEKTETEGDQVESSESSNNAFAFAKVWSSHRDGLDELPDEVPEDQTDSWAQALAKLQAEQNPVQAQERAGRGVRRKAAQMKVKYFDDVSPDKIGGKGKKRSTSQDSRSSDGEFNLPKVKSASESVASNDADDTIAMTEVIDLDGRMDMGARQSTFLGQSLLNTNPRKPKKRKREHTTMHPAPSQNKHVGEDCGLCGASHGPGQCFMTRSSKNLAEYRWMLTMNTEEESYEDRALAIEAIDETLRERQDIHLIHGQPLTPLKKSRTMFTSRKLDFVNLVADDSYSSSSKMSDPPRAEAGSSRTYPIVSLFENQGPRRDGTSDAGLKRMPSGAAGPSMKKPKGQRPCEICKQTPHHVPTVCPVVLAGPKSITKAISRLTNEGGRAETLSILRTILRQQKKAPEVNAASSSAPQS